MPVVTVLGGKVLRGPRRTLELELELYRDPAASIYGLVQLVTKDIVVRATMVLGKDKSTSEARVHHSDLFDGELFNVTVEGVLANLFVSTLIPKMTEQLKDEYIEAVQNGTFPNLKP